MFHFVGVSSLGVPPNTPVMKIPKFSPALAILLGLAASASAPAVLTLTLNYTGLEADGNNSGAARDHDFSSSIWTATGAGIGAGSLPGDFAPLNDYAVYGWDGTAGTAPIIRGELPPGAADLPPGVGTNVFPSGTAINPLSGTFNTNGNGDGNAYNFFDETGTVVPGADGFRFNSGIVESSIDVGAGTSGTIYAYVAAWNDGATFNIDTQNPGAVIQNGTLIAAPGGSLAPDPAFTAPGVLDFGQRDVGVVAIAYSNAGMPATTINFDWGGGGDQKLHAIAVTSIPEPSRALLLVGAIAVAGFGRRRR